VRAAALTALLVAVGAILFVTRIDGVVAIDEDSYLASVVSLRAGRLTVPGTEGLLPSRELLSFDAAPLTREVSTTPVASAAPPLYAFVALPFVAFGWPGLVALQTASFLLCAALVFHMTARHTRRPGTPWLATLTFLAGGYSIEYAQGVWPHMLSTLLCLAALDAAARARMGGSSWFLLAGGLAAGLACGVRYQNVVLGAMIALGVLALSPRARLRGAAVFLFGMAVPLLANTAINASRLDSWNPISKGPRYLTLTRGPIEPRELLVEGLVSTWARIVDRAATPSLKERYEGIEEWLQRDRATGEVIIEGALKKAWLQSSPWMLLALIGLARAWPRGRSGDPVARELRAASLLLVGVLGMFALYGFRRYDGRCFNERYLFELVPVLAVALAWLMDGVEWRWRWLAIGAIGGCALPLVPLTEHPEINKYWVLGTPPLALAASAAALWWFRPGRAASVALLVGACLGWGLATHLTDDLPASRRLRRVSETRLMAAREVLPRDERLAIFAPWGTRNALGPLLLDHDLVIVDPRVDGGKDAPVLLGQLRAQGRRIFIMDEVPAVLGCPEPKLRVLWSRGIQFFECRQ
jgi:hypothetical protein